MRALLVILLADALISGCAPAPLASGQTASTVPVQTTPASTRPSASALDTPVPARVILKRHWFTIPDALFGEPAAIVAEFDADPSRGFPVARLRPGGREAPLARAVAVNALGAEIDLHGLGPGTYTVEIVEHLSSGAEAIVAASSIVLSRPEYVVWTLDFEGDTAAPEELANTAAIADGLHVAMTLMWNARVWTTTQVSAASADAMLAWTKARTSKGDEVALHIHAWTDFVRDAGVAPRTVPNWGGRTDGYDVPLTAFDEGETAKLIARALELMTAHGLAKPTSFRGGGLFANAANLRAVAAAGFTVDASGTPAGVFGRLPLPWTLAKDAQPYHPSATDANLTGALPVLEVPNIAGNTFGYTSSTIQTTIRDDLAMLAPAGEAAASTRVLTLVSHPATIDATERGAIEALFGALAPLRYDNDRGPLRFVTLAQIAAAMN